MSLVKQIALGLNIVVPVYFFIYQLYQQHQYSTQFTFTILIKSSIVLISPIFHILALLNPSYCYNGHCSPPHHYKKSFLQQKYPHLHPYQPKQISSKLKFHDDLIQQSITSSNNDLNKIDKEIHHKLQLPHKPQLSKRNQKQLKSLQTPQRKQQFQTVKKQDNHKSEKKQDVIFNRMDSPPLLNKFSVSYEQPKTNQASNVNEFSNIPFFSRSSRKSVSNLANSESPRHSRRSIVQVAQPSIIQPLIKLTPIKQKEQKNEQKVIDYSNKKQYDDVKQHIEQNNLYSPYHQYLSSQRIQCQLCQQCQIPKYLRMKHCYRCSKCVHKYDHHCVLLNICIGERNQKYYIGFLYAHFYNTCIILQQLLRDIKDDVTIDMGTGIQSINNFYVLKAFCIILLLLNFVLTIYLLLIHTKFLFNGLTTYQKQRRLTINYFKYIRKNYRFYQTLKHMDKQQIQNYHPFDQGPIKNVFKVITASKQPYDWKLPFQQSKQIMVEMKDKKQMAKSTQNIHPQKIEGYQWGQQSQSSNYLHAAKTTKSRQSAIRKSKQAQEKHKKENICR